MTLEQPIKAAIETVDGLYGKFYPMEGLKQATAPFAFYRQTAEEEEDTLAGPSGLMEVSFEIHFVARTYSELIRLCSAGRAALQSLQGTTHEDLLIERITIRQASPDLKESEVKFYRRMYVLTINYQREEF